MYRSQKENEEQNFWISYADLMAGLLFVFILLVGAIVVRYVFVQQDLAAKKVALGKTESALSQSMNALDSQSEKVKSFREKLAIAASSLEKEAQDRVSLVEKLKLQGNDVSKLKELLMGYELDNKNLEENLSTMQMLISKNQNILVLKDEELAVLGSKLLEESKAHQMLVDELNITKVRIKNLTGIRIKVVSKLRDTLGNSIMIDPKSGAIRFSSKILFNAGEYKLKAAGKQELREVINQYIHTLLFNDDIKQYIDNITIEGHTDTDGTYLYNLALSQKRALEVMKFLYESDPQNRELYSRYLSASGRSYADLILDEYGNEDKEASRRIEIKFRIKNEQAVKELENFLNK